MRFNIFLLGLLISTSVIAQVYTPKFDLQGHRGARGLRPENSIPAFLFALDSGVTTLELDVVISKDKQVVVSHEPWMSAAICLQPDGAAITQGDDQKLFNMYQMNYTDIREFDCGSLGNERFPEQVKMRVSKPLLQDVIIAVEEHIKSYTQYEVDYNIEIKSSPDGDKKFHPGVEEFSDLVYEVIDKYLPLERIVIQSFDFRVLKYWQKKYPGIRLAALVENNKSVETNLKNLGFTPAIYSPYYQLLKKEDVDYLHKRKIRVIPWTVNEENEMLSMRGLGVDGIITDYPDRARKYKMTLALPR